MAELITTDSSIRQWPPTLRRWRPIGLTSWFKKKKDARQFFLLRLDTGVVCVSFGRCRRILRAFKSPRALWPPLNYEQPFDMNRCVVRIFFFASLSGEGQCVVTLVTTSAERYSLWCRHFFWPRDPIKHPSVGPLSNLFLSLSSIYIHTVHTVEYIYIYFFLKKDTL